MASMQNSMVTPFIASYPMALLACLFKGKKSKFLTTMLLILSPTPAKATIPRDVLSEISDFFSGFFNFGYEEDLTIRDEIELVKDEHSRHLKDLRAEIGLTRNDKGYPGFMSNFKLTRKPRSDTPRKMKSNFEEPEEPKYQGNFEGYMFVLDQNLKTYNAHPEQKILIKKFTLAGLKATQTRKMLEIDQSVYITAKGHTFDSLISTLDAMVKEYRLQTLEMEEPELIRFILEEQVQVFVTNSRRPKRFIFGILIASFIASIVIGVSGLTYTIYSGERNHAVLQENNRIQKEQWEDQKQVNKLEKRRLQLEIQMQEQRLKCLKEEQEEKNYVAPSEDPEKTLKFFDY